MIWTNHKAWKWDSTKRILLPLLPKPTFYFSPQRIIRDRVKSGLEENGNILILANFRASSLRLYLNHSDSWFWFSRKCSLQVQLQLWYHLKPAFSHKNLNVVVKETIKHNFRYLYLTRFDGKLFFVHDMDTEDLCLTLIPAKIYSHVYNLLIKGALHAANVIPSAEQYIPCWTNHMEYIFTTCLFFLFSLFLR